MKKNIQSHIIRALGLAMFLMTLFSGCSKESVTPDDKKDDKPVELPGIKMIDGGKNHTMLLKTDGTLWATGDNEIGQLGTGDNISKFKFIKVLTDVEEVACGRNYTLALKSDGSVWVTGDNEKGQLGTGDNLNLNTFTKVLDDIKAIDAGDRHSMALGINKTLKVTGDNTYGQLTLNDQYNTFTDVMVAESIIAGAYNSFVMDEDHNLWGAGANFTGQLGAFDYENQTMFKKIISGIKKISSGYTYTMILKENGTFLASGVEYYVHGGPKGVSDFYEVTGHDVTDVVSGYNHYLFVSDSSLWGVGVNDNGQLGIDKPPVQDSFVELVDSNVARVFTGYYSTWYIDGQGRLWATGANTKGELGTGDMETRKEFELIEL